MKEFLLLCSIVLLGFSLQLLGNDKSDSSYQFSELENKIEKDQVANSQNDIDFFKGSVYSAPVGIGNTINSNYGFAIGLQADLRNKSNDLSFGYNNFNFKANYNFVTEWNLFKIPIIPSTSLGLVNWYVPAAKDIYKDGALDSNGLKISDQNRNVGFIQFGLNFGSRSITDFKLEKVDLYKKRADTFRKKQIELMSQPVKSIIALEELNSDFKKFVDSIYLDNWNLIRKSPIFALGSSFFMDLSENETKSSAFAYDVFSSFSWGYSLVDFNINAHYLSFPNSDTIANESWIINGGVYLDFTSKPNSSRLAFTFTYGEYKYNKMQFLLENTPTVIQKDLSILLMNLKNDKDDDTYIGIRWSWITDFNRDKLINNLALVYSSNLRVLFKK